MPTVSKYSKIGLLGLALPQVASFYGGVFGSTLVCEQRRDDRRVLCVNTTCLAPSCEAQTDKHVLKSKISIETG